MQSPEACHAYSTSPPAGREVSACSRGQLEMLVQENKRLRQELEGHTEKALKIQKVKFDCNSQLDICLCFSNISITDFGCQYK